MIQTVSLHKKGRWRRGPLCTGLVFILSKSGSPVLLCPISFVLFPLLETLLETVALLRQEFNGLLVHLFVFTLGVVLFGQTLILRVRNSPVAISLFIQ